jgi:hypothetical protein
LHDAAASVQRRQSSKLPHPKPASVAQNSTSALKPPLNRPLVSPSAGAVLSAPTAYHSTKTGRHASLVPESKYADKRITRR